MIDENNTLFIEQNILGIILLNNDVLHQIPYLKHTHFLNSTNGKIFQYIQERFINGKNTDLILLTNFLQREEIPVNYIKALQSSYGFGNIIPYVKLLKEMSLKREMLFLSREINDIVKKNKDEIREDILKIEEKILNMLSDEGESETYKLHDSMIHTLEVYQNKQSRFFTGFKKLDELTGGFGVGELIILAARPSVGKTAYAVNIAMNMASRGIGVLFLSLEMPQEQICMRILANKTAIPITYFVHRKLSTEMLVNCSKEIEVLRSCPLFINDNPNCNLGRLRNILRTQIRNNNIKVVFIDYLQLIISTRKDSREQEISTISRTLKILSKELKVSIVCLSQMSRDIEKRSEEKKEPRLSDLRESGAIEQDSDMVMFLCRQKQDQRDKVVLYLKKNRNGSLGNLYYNFQGETMNFLSIQKEKNNNIIEL